MGFLNSLRGATDQEPSFSRDWIALTGGKPRKTELALAVLNRVRLDPKEESVAPGSVLELDVDLANTRQVFDQVLDRERSLAAAVARDFGVVFESFGGLGVNRAAALATVGLNQEFDFDPPINGGQANSQTQAVEVARSVFAISQVVAGGATEMQRGYYNDMFENVAGPGYTNAAAVSGWAAIVVGRLVRTGGLDSNLPIFNSDLREFPPMEQAGWYPNPLNAGDISDGTAEIERYWDGQDWTAGVRLRQGRSWQEVEATLQQPMT